MKKAVSSRPPRSVSQRGILLLFGIEGLFLQFITSVNTYGNNIYATNLGATDLQIGMVELIPNLVAVCFLLPIGILANRLRSSKTLPLCLLCLMGCMYLGMGTVPSLGASRMGFFFLFLGLTVGTLVIYNAQWQTFFGDVTQPDERNSIYTFRNRLMFVTGTAVPLLCGMALSAVPDSAGKLAVQRYFYYTCGLLLFLQAWTLSRIPGGAVSESVRPREKFSFSSVGTAIREAWDHRPFRSFFLAAFFFYLGWHIDWSVWYLGETQYMGMTELHLGIFSSGSCVVQLLAIGFFSRLNSRKSVHFSIIFAILGQWFSSFAMVGASLFPMEIRPWVFVCLAVAATIPQSCLQLCMVQILLEVVPRKNRALIISLYTLLVTLSNGVMPYVGVQIFTAIGGDFRALLLFYGMVLVWKALAVAVFILRYRKISRERNSGASLPSPGTLE